MLPYENENLELVRQHFGAQLDATTELLHFGLRTEEALLTKLQDQECGQDNRAPVIVLSLVNQVLRRYRAVILLAERGFIPEAEVMTRSLFDSQLALRFVVVPQIPNPGWSANLQGEFRMLSDLSGSDSLSRFTEMDFRASLYASSEYLRLKRMREATSADALSDVGRGIAREIEQDIGPDWVERLRNPRVTYSGFSSMRLLAEYCGLESYYRSAYALQSMPTHGQGSIRLLRSPSPDQVKGVLTLPGLLLAMSLEDINGAFSLGIQHEVELAKSRFLRAIG